MKQKKKQRLERIVIVLFLFGMAGIGFALCRKPQAQREDYRRIASTEYDTVFLSMYPLDTYKEEDFSHYRAMTVFKASYCIPRLSVMKKYMRRVAKSGNTITTVYLGIRPDQAEPEKLHALLNSYPGVDFEIIISYPSADYWRSLTQKDYERTLSEYSSFLTAIPYMESANFYFMSSEEWLINNPLNYIDEWTVTESVATIIMTHSDPLHDYLVTDVNTAILSLAELTQRLRLGQEKYPDLSDTCVLFFGDSVIANYTDSTSIPGVVSAMTDAIVFNCGWGGNSAAKGTADDVALPDIIEAFFRDDKSRLSQDAQAYKGIASYFSSMQKDKNACFVINYGLNDYFKGYPVSGEEPYDTATFCGAFRVAVNTIRANIPDAQIILCTPNFVTAFENGAEPHGCMENVLADYAEAVIALANELDTDLLDNFHELGITPENDQEYLVDGIHPGFACRYLMGKRLSLMIR